MTINTHAIDRHHPLRHGAFRSSDVRALIAEQLGVEVERVTDQSHLMNDLGLDWLTRLELVIFVEESTGVELLDDDVDQIKFVSDLIRYIASAEEERDRLAALPDAANDRSPVSSHHLLQKLACAGSEDT